MNANFDNTVEIVDEVCGLKVVVLFSEKKLEKSFSFLSDKVRVLSREKVIRKKTNRFLGEDRQNADKKLYNWLKSRLTEIKVEILFRHFELKELAKHV